MKRFFTFLLVFSLVFSPVFSSGNHEKNLKTIFFGDKTQQTSSTEKSQSQSNEQSKSETTSTILETSPENSNIAEMTTDEIVNEIVATSDSSKKANTETLKALVVVKATNDMLGTQVAQLKEYTANLETDYETVSNDLINSNLKIESQNGEIDTLKEKLKQDKNFKFALVGVNYNKTDGYGATFDLGVKYSSGLMTSVGVSAPISAFNPIDALDLNSYTFNTKIGWAW